MKSMIDSDVKLYRDIKRKTDGSTDDVDHDAGKSN